jgi:peptidoglycan hydrolase-like protein with peptidoglycan-binding domain
VLGAVATRARPTASERAYRDEADEEPEEEERDEEEPGGRVHRRVKLARFNGNPDFDALQAGSKSFKKGDKGPTIRRLQQGLFDLGFTPISVHGVFDDLMVERVKELQGNAKLAKTGEIDSDTFDAMELRFEDRTIYAGTAQVTAPGLHAPQNGWDEKKPPDALMRNTHTLSDAEKKEAKAALAPDKQSIGQFKPDLPDGKNYAKRLDELLRDKVEQQWEDTGKNAKTNHKRTFSLGTAVDVGTCSKNMTDQVYGSWRVGPPWTAGKNLVDKFAVQSEQIEKADDKHKLAIAEGRVEKILNSDDAIESLSREHSADRSRDDERKISDKIKKAVAHDFRDKLLDIQRGWTASANNGVVELRLTRSDDAGDNRDRLWVMFARLVHEYIHTLASDNWRHLIKEKSKADPEAGATLREGVTEFLARAVLSVVNPADKGLRQQVEGDYYDDDNKEIPDITRTAYGTETKRAEELVGAVGINNLYAAFFLGQTRLVGE